MTDQQRRPDNEQATPDNLDEPQQPSGEHVVVTPQTAGSAGGAHTNPGKEN